MELSRKSCLSKLFLKLLFGTVVQKLSCGAISRGGMSIGIPGFCDVLLSNGRGLGRSLSYVGRSQISLFVMPHATLVHKSPYELFLEPLHATVVQKLPLNLFLKLLHGAVVQKLLFEAIS